jgi:putative cardiolipin synthase
LNEARQRHGCAPGAVTLRLQRWLVLLLVAAVCSSPQADPDPAVLIDARIAAEPERTGVHVLDTGAQALVARAWLVENARHSIEVQYFIWSSDNVGILAAEALLRAAERGVKVRVVVDDLLIDAPDESLLALARHPNIDIRIYNPKKSVGVPLQKRLLNLFADFRGFNQRMHDKTLVVDGRWAITGGRNMAAEYFDYNHRYNFRDRDVLLFGHAVRAMRSSFESFWSSPSSVPVESQFDGMGLMQKNVRVDDAAVQRAWRDLHAYARSPENFAPEVRAAIAAAPAVFARLAQEVRWVDAEFIADAPGKNDGKSGLAGGGRSTAQLARLLEGAQRKVLIQSPYLVPSDEAMALLRRLRERNVQVRISTNSMASTDNLPAFSGYRNRRDELLALGVEVFEYKPDPQVQRQLMQRAAPLRTAPPQEPPIFSLHAKSLVVDGRSAYVGTFNFDPRSQNLNTEVGVIVRDESLAREVEA